jgi:hypothetical protein
MLYDTLYTASTSLHSHTPVRGSLLAPAGFRSHRTTHKMCEIRPLRYNCMYLYEAHFEVRALQQSPSTLITLQRSRYIVRVQCWTSSAGLCVCVCVCVLDCGVCVCAPRFVCAPVCQCLCCRLFFIKCSGGTHSLRKSSITLGGCGINKTTISDGILSIFIYQYQYKKY